MAFPPVADEKDWLIVPTGYGQESIDLLHEPCGDVVLRTMTVHLDTLTRITEGHECRVIPSDQQDREAAIRDAHQGNRYLRERDRMLAEGDDMCPNCLTPWKCNGPHIPPATSDTYDAGALVRETEGGCLDR